MNEIPLVVLVILEYRGELFLRGARQDLKLLLEWTTRWPCDVVVFTDIDELPINKETISYCPIYQYNDVKKYFKPWPRRVIIVYSGHGQDDNGIMPNDDMVPMTTMATDFSRNLPIDGQIAWLMDCCNPSHLALPFELSNNQFKFRNNIVSPLMMEPTLMLITSADINQNSVISPEGSIFISGMISFLTQLAKVDGRIPISLENNRNLMRLCDHVTEKMNSFNHVAFQRVNVYASKPIDPVVWLWIGTTWTLEVDVTGAIMKFT
jgi:hypothetical protein